MCLCVSVFVCVCVCKHKYMFVCMLQLKWFRLCVCVRVYVCVCVFQLLYVMCVNLPPDACKQCLSRVTCMCLPTCIFDVSEWQEPSPLSQTGHYNKINYQQSIHFVNRCTQTTIIPTCFPQLPPFPEDWQHSAACHTFQIFHVNKWFGWIIQMQRRSNCLLFSHCLQILQTILKLSKSLLSPNKMTQIVWNSFWWFLAHTGQYETTPNKGDNTYDWTYTKDITLKLDTCIVTSLKIQTEITHK